MKKVREFFWPLLEKGVSNFPNKYESEDIIIDEENLEKSLDYIYKIYESELSRSSTIESKSSLFIGTLSVITTVILGITTLLIRSNNFNLSLLLLIITLFIVIIYIIRTIWFSIRVLERKSFHIIFYNDIIQAGKKTDYLRQIIATLINKINKNIIVTNSKVDNMTMAQEYFKRALITIILYSVFLVLFFIDKFHINLLNYKNEIIKMFNSIYFTSGLAIIFTIIIIISLVINFILLRKISNTKRSP